MTIHDSRLLVAAFLFGCSAAPVEGEPSVDLTPADHEAGRLVPEHYNHWAPASAGGMDQVIGSGTYYANCSNWSLWDYGAWDAAAYGFHEYRTKNATWTQDSTGAPYAGASWDTCDGYGGENCSVAARLNQLGWSNVWWQQQPNLWDTVVGWNGSVYANTSSRSHVAGHCTGAFVLTFDADPAYTRGEYWVHVYHEKEVTDQTSCTSTSGDNQLWNAVDLYVRECTPSGNCQDRIGGYAKRTNGTWNSSYCDTMTTVVYQPPYGYRPVYLNAVVSAGVGHVPSAAKIAVSRWYF
jgi:hypothetical protein